MINGLVRSMAITGGTQFVGVLLSIARNKGVSLMLGPTGIAVMSVLESLKAASALLAGLGLASAGVREVAQSRQDLEKLAAVRRMLMVAHLVQGLLAAAVIWVFRVELAVWLLNDEIHSRDVAIVAIALVFTLLSSAQIAILRGLRRVGDVGRVTVIASALSTAIGLFGVWRFGLPGVVLFAFAQPFFSSLAALYFSRKLPAQEGHTPTAAVLLSNWKGLLAIGLAFMIGAALTPLAGLYIRYFISNELGLQEVGFFAAAWGVSVTYLGFLLSAMGMDYYPRLAEAIHDKTKSSALINLQARLGVMIAGPVLYLLVGLAPMAIYILYSSQFEQSVVVLQWQSAGNLLKIASWPFAFAFLAAAHSRAFLISQLSFHVVYVGLITLGLGAYGIEMTGIAFVIAYGAYFLIVYGMIRYMFAFRLERETLALLALHFALMAGLLLLTLNQPIIGGAAAILLFILTGLHGGRSVIAQIGLSPKTAFLFRIFERLGWPVRTRQ